MQHKAIISPIVTPLNHQGAICKDSVRRLLGQLGHYVAGVVPCLTSGEGWLLNDEQWREMLATTTEIIGAGRVIAGIEKPTTTDILEHISFVRELGVRSIMVTSPFGSEVTQNEVFEHYQRISKESDLEVFIYNEHALSGNITEFETLLKIAEISNIVAIKDSPECSRTSEQIAELRDKGLRYYFGWEEELFTGKQGDGNIVSLSNIEPLLCHMASRYTDACLAPIIHECVKDYKLDNEEWFQEVKNVLFERGVISSSRVVSFND